MNVYQCVKIASVVLFLNACSSGDGPESTNPASGSGNDDLSTGLSPNGESGGLSADGSGASGISADDVSALNADDVISVLNTDATSALSSSVGSASSTAEAAAGVDPTTPTVTDATDTAPEVAVPDSTDNNTTGIVRIPRTDTPNAPKIDANTLDYLTGTEQLDGEWRSAAQFDDRNEPLAISQYMFGEPGTNNDNARHHWAALHDGLYLYLLVISDDAGENFQDTNEFRKPWKDDSVEIFIDGNNSQLTEYDGVDDFHITINLLSSTGVTNNSFIADPEIIRSAASAALPSDLIFAAGPRKGPAALGFDRGRKDIYEIRIKLSELNIQVGAPFGFEVQINDDDNGDNRDSKWGWNHPEGTSSDNDFTWQNPSFMGTLILVD